MSILETSLIYVGIPALVTAIIAVTCLVLSRPIAGTHPAHFNLGDKWTHEPVLWSATDEVTTHAHHGGHAAIEAAPADLIGGSANGRW